MRTPPSESIALFGAYDIRGRYPQDFSVSTRRRIADAFRRAIPGPLVVARDARRASAELERAVVARIEAPARPVLRLGVQPTPVVGFASAYLSVHGLAFTPSHNAVGYAGIKAFGSSGRSFGAEWKRVRREFLRAPRPVGAATPRRTRARAEVRAKWTRGAVIDAYLAHVTNGLETSRSVVIDGRGGATTRLAPRALVRAGARVRELHPRFSPSFHRLSPEPLRENVRDLGRAVRARRADLGIAFDGDGDRVVFVDELGEWVEPEVIGLLLHRNLSPTDRPLVASADASQRCESRVPTVRSRVGGRYVSAAMRAHRSPVGFEASSHFYLERWGPNSDGVLTASVVCHLLDEEGTSLRRLSRSFGPIVRDREQLDFESRAEAIRHYRTTTAAIASRLERGIDGFVFRSAEGTVLLRLSNTQPSIRILFEPNPGRSLGGLRRKWAEVAGELGVRRSPA